MAKRRVRWRAVALGTALAALLAAWATAHHGSRIVEHVLARELRNRLEAEVRTTRVSIGLLPPAVSISGLEVSRGDVPLVSAASIDLRLAAWRSLWEGAWIADLIVDSPRLVYDARDPLWSSLRSADGRGRGEPAFLPRRVEVRGGSIEARLDDAGTMAALEDVSIDLEVSGLLAPEASFAIAASGRAERRGHTLRLPQIRLLGRASSAAIAVEQLVAAGDPGTLRAAVTLGEGRVAGRVDWSGTIDPVFALLPEAGRVAGGGDIHARFEGPLEEPVVRADLEARGVDIHGVVFSGKGRLDSRGIDWALSPASAEIFGGHADGRATGRWTAGIPYRLQAAFRDWNPKVFVKLFGPDVPLFAIWSGEARLDGVLLKGLVAGDGRFTLREGAQTAHGTATFQVEHDHARVEGTLTDAAESGTRASVRYRVDEHRIAGDVELDAARLAAFSSFLRLDLTGSAHGRATFSGSTHDPRFGGEVRTDRLSVLGVEVGTADAAFEISRTGLRADRLRIDDGGAQGRGQVALTRAQRNDWTARLAGVPLDRAMALGRHFLPSAPDGSGRLSADVRLSGPWSDPEVEATVAVADGVVAGETVGSLSGTVARRAGSWSVVGDARRPDGANAHLDARLTSGGNLDGRIAAEAWELASLAAIQRRWPGVSGVVEIRGSLAGTRAQPQGEAAVRIADLRFAERSLGATEVRARLERGKLVADGTVGEAVRAHLSLATATPWGFTLGAEWRDFDWARWAFPQAGGLSARSSGTAELQGDPADPLRRGHATVSEVVVGTGEHRLSNPAPIVARLRDGVLEVTDGRLEGEGQQIAFSAHLAPDASTFHASTRGDLAILEALSSTVASARGSVEGEIRGARRGQEPWTLSGGGKVRGGALDVAFLIGITDLQADFRLADRRIEVENLTGRLGGGGFLVAGRASLDEGYDLGWAVHDASLGVPDWLDYRARGNGRVEGRLAAPKITGEVEVLQAVYDRRIEWAEFLPWFRREARATRGGPAAPVSLDLRIFADGGLFVDNNLAKVELRGDARVAGALDSLRWAGRIDVVSGEFLFRRRSFQITSGNVQFAEARPMNPSLDFLGETSVSTRDEDYQIQVQVSGTAEEPRIEFTADDPTLTENDVLALVTFGRTVSQLQSQGAGIELAEVLAITTGPRAPELEEQIHTLLPVDAISIEPSFSRTTGASEPRLSISKDLTERLRAVLGTGLGAERRQDVGLEYQLSRQISLQGVWESQTKSEAGAFGGTLKFRVPFRSATPFSLLQGAADEAAARGADVVTAGEEAIVRPLRGASGDEPAREP